ncbi:MAG TPA: choice-of-anchor D domain-containing protein [Candidatus Dormibacteraeota bacterium]|nr:choice-of-anchor D domain-containing protein [Candidatus Dormibacteraeota bacterium]
MAGRSGRVVSAAAAAFVIASAFAVYPVAAATPRSTHAPVTKVQPPRDPHANGRHVAIPKFAALPPKRFSAPLSSSARTAAAAATAAAPAVGGSWTFQGPQPINGLYSQSSGRVTSLAVDPTSSATVYAGTPGGGVWKTTDSGVHWAPLTDGQPDLAIGAVAVDPNNHLTVYAGTGEPNRGIDSIAGVGVMKSTDGGATWTIYGGGQLSGQVIYSVVVDRTNSTHVSVAASNGLWQSTDGGQTYTRNTSLLNLSPPLGNGVLPHVDVVLQDPDPAHSGYWFAAVDEACSGSGFIGISKDGGVTWTTSVRASLLATVPVTRFGLAEGPGGVLYTALAACTSTSPPAYSQGQLLAAFKSSDFGLSWQVIPNIPDFYSAGSGIYQGWFDNVIAVDPTNANHAVFGGVTLVATSNGGSTFTDVAKPYNNPPGPLHPDFHAVAFTGANSFYTGNDGGVWSTTDLGGTGVPNDWSNLNTTLGVTTFYGGAALDSNRMLGGAQDEGTSLRSSSSVAWNLVQGSDGVNVQWRGGTTFYGELPYLTIFYQDYSDPDPRHAQLAAPCAVQTDPACSDPTYALAPFVLDPSPNSSTVYGATNKVYRSVHGGIPAGAPEWQPITGDLTTGKTIFAGGDAITAMAISQDGNTMAVGSFGGKLWRIDNLHGTPVFTDLTSTIPAFNFNNYAGVPWITGVALSNCVPPSTNGAPTQCNVIAALGALGVGRVWSIPYAASRVDLTSNLDTINPNTVVLSVYATSNGPFASNGSEGLYIGTLAGAFMCGTCPQAGAPSWSVLGTGLPNSPVWQINVTADGADVVAWTHGRGAWILPRTSAYTLTPSSLNFPTTTVGESSPAQGVTITSTGVGSVHFSTPSSTFIGPNFQDFGPGNPFVSNCTVATNVTVVPPGQSCQLNVVYAPVGAAGAGTAALQINSDAPNPQPTVALNGTAQRPAAAVSPNSLNFNGVLVNTTSTLTLTYTNQGPGNLHVFGWTVQLNPSEYTVSTQTCIGVSVAPNATCTLDVAFTPLASGQRLGTLVINDNSTTSKSIPLSGTGTLTNATFSPTSLTFGPQDAGTTSPVQHVTVTAQGPGPFIPRPFNGSIGSSSPDFFGDWGTCANAPTQPGNTCTANIYFAPKPGSAGGSRTATISLNDNASGTPQSILVSGTALTPSVTISPTSISFGNQSVGMRSQPVTVTLSNAATATGDYIVSQILPRADFFGGPPAIVSGSDHCTGIKVAPGSSCTFIVTWTPTGAANASSNIELFDNAVDPSGYDQVLWTGLAQPPSPSSSGNINFGYVTLGTTATATLTFTNGGPGQMLISNITLTPNPDFTVPGATDGCTGITVAANRSCAVQVDFTPSLAQQRTSTLQAFYNGGSVSVQLTGIGATPFNGLYVLEAYGGLHGDDAPYIANQPYFGWNIARAAKPYPLASNGQVGLVLDGWGGLHPFGTPALQIGQEPYYPNLDVARDFVFLPDGTGGYELDAWGGIHPFSIGNNPLPPQPWQYPYFPGQDVAIKITLLPDKSGGYVLDRFGGLHPWSVTGKPLPVQIAEYGYWYGQNIARDIWLVPGSSATSASGYVLDAYGGFHPFWSAGAAAPTPITVYGYWSGRDLARAMWFTPTSDGSNASGYTLDAFGGLHPFASAGVALPRPISQYGYWPGQDLAKSLWAN